MLDKSVASGEGRTGLQFWAGPGQALQSCYLHGRPAAAGPAIRTVLGQASGASRIHVGNVSLELFNEPAGGVCRGIARKPCILRHFSGTAWRARQIPRPPQRPKRLIMHFSLEKKRFFTVYKCFLALSSRRKCRFFLFLHFVPINI